MSTARTGAPMRAHRHARRSGLGLALVALSLLTGVLTAGTAEARTNNRSKVVLFVHGYNPTSTSTNCGGDFDTMISQMRAEGFTGSLVKVGWYSGDTNCNVNLHSYMSYGDRDSWRTIGKAFSWYVYNTYTSRGITVDVVGYSMGGLISRGAILGSSRGDSGYAPSIDVEDEVTLGTPHQGAAGYSNLCFWGQCASMKPGSGDISWLNGNGNPQGRYGTEWTNIGSYQDDVVPYASATSMSIPSANKVIYSNISHTGAFHPNYMHSGTVITRAGNGLANSGQ
jgi:hypothetical protein